METPPRLAAALADRYRIERELGAGGMATVYLAQDLKHDRKVALKVLRPELAAVIGAERFLSEIKTTANLQHPHILPLFDSGEADSFLFYVMPYVEGETVRDRITREKQLPVADAVRITSEVAAALDYAHRHGVIHRDIKPENILLHDGSALVADFGIALAASKAGGTRMTETGMSLGTPHYMSPEQAMGDREISARSDVYALGCVAYEMLVGEPPFTGPTAQAIIARVMTEEPRTLTLQRKTIPPGVEAAVFTALEKLPADRFATAAEFAAALANPTTATARTSLQPVAAPLRRRNWLVAGVVGAAALLAGVLIGGRTPSPGSVGPDEVVKASLALGDSAVVRSVSNARLAIAPSGRRVAFVGADGADNALWVRDLDQPAARKLPDTKGAFAPFFSPDGESIGFFTTSGGGTALKVIPIAGGVARTIVPDSVAPFGGTGGAVTHVSHPDSSTGVQEHDYPDVLPGSKRALVMLWMGSIGSNHIGLVDLSTGAVTDLTAGSYARYVAPGYLAIGASDGRVLAAPFDSRRGTLGGTPVLMLDDVQAEATNGTVQFAVSETGMLVYQPETGGSGGLVWVDRAGKRTPVDTTLKQVGLDVALSPDGREIVLTRSESGDNQIWIKQLATGTLSRISFDVENADRAVWTPDGRRVAYLATRNNKRSGWIRRADGSDSAKAAYPGAMDADEIAFDPRMEYTLLRSGGAGLGSRHLMVVKNGVDTVPRSLVQSRFDNFAMTISPDGQWMAYVSLESGTPEVYVRPFPGVDSARFVISVGGGQEPVWSRDGRELFFRSPRGDMYAVPVTTGQRFSTGVPKLLFLGTGFAIQDYHRSYDVHPDGKRFLMVAAGGADANSVNVVFNWRVELEKLKQAAK